jgi:hypothetical protein
MKIKITAIVNHTAAFTTRDATKELMTNPRVGTLRQSQLLYHLTLRAEHRTHSNSLNEIKRRKKIKYKKVRNDETDTNKKK